MAIIKESLGDIENNHLSTKQAKWCTMAQQFRSPATKKDEVVPMEIDLAQVQSTNPEQEVKNTLLCREGRCYKCKKQWHIKKNYPTWEKKGEKPPPYQPKGRVATTSTTATTSTATTSNANEEPGMKELACHMKALDDNGKD